jgi:hypothetical protein
MVCVLRQNAQIPPHTPQQPQRAREKGEEEAGWGRWARRMVFGREQGREREYKRRERWREEKGVRVRNPTEENGWVEIEMIS